MDRPADIIRLSSHGLLRFAGVAVHVNRPRHAGDTPLHDHDFCELALVTGGRAVHRTVHGEGPVRSGDLFVLHPGQWHAYERCRDLSLVNCCIGLPVLARELAWVVQDPALGRLLPTRLANSGRQADQGVLKLHLPPDEAERCRSELERIHALQLANGTIPVQARSEVIARLLLTLGLLAEHLPPATGTGPMAPPAAIEQVLEAMENRLDHPWSLDALASLAGLGRFPLERQFRQHLGCPPIAWLLRRRAEQAAVLLLTTDSSVTDIGKQVGWDDPSYFARRFRAVFGQNPGDYRRHLPMPAVRDSSQDWVQW